MDRADLTEHEEEIVELLPVAPLLPFPSACPSCWLLLLEASFDGKPLLAPHLMARPFCPPLDPARGQVLKGGAGARAEARWER